jgi:hypothetical protein
MQQLILYIIIQSLVLGAVLFSTRKKENNLLGALFLTIFLQHLVLYNQHEWRPKYPELFLFLYALTLCRIPLMFFYIKLLLKKSVEKIHFTLWLFPLTCCFLAIYFYLFKLYNPSANSLNFILNLSGTIISCIFLFSTSSALVASPENNNQRLLLVLVFSNFQSPDLASYPPLLYILSGFVKV